MKKPFLMFLVGLLIASAAMAAVPSQMNVQGRLLNAGSPMTGSHPADFKIYDAATAGNLLWTENSSLIVQGGIFTAIIGSTTPIPTIVFAAQSRWLEVTVDGSILSPRLALTTSAYSFWAQRADTANVALSGAGSNELWSTDGTNVWRPNGNVGINTVPQVPLHLRFGSATDANTAARFEFTGAGASDIEFTRSSSANGQTPRTLRIRGGNDFDAFPSFELGTATDHPLRFMTNAAERMRIAENGYVGIGTATPASRLHTTGMSWSTGDDTPLSASAGKGVGVGYARPEAFDGGYIFAFDYTTGTPKNLILNNPGGNVGIGATNPSAPLHVKGLNQIARFEGGSSAVSDAYVSLVNTQPGARQYDLVSTSNTSPTGPGNFFIADASAGARIAISSAGLVGIGTAAPTARLDVAGSVRSSSGGFVFPDGSTQVTAAGASLWASSGSDAYSTNAGNVFIGGTSTGDPTSKLQIIAPSPQILLRDTNAGVNQTIGVDGAGLSVNYDGGHALTVSRASGNVSMVGSLTVAGAKCRAVEGTKYGTLYFNAVESGAAIFTTSGRSELINGEAHIALDPKWLAGVTIDDQHPLDVTTVTFYGPHGDWYVVPGTTGFDLVDPSSSCSSFFWAVQARQKGYEDLYLDRLEPTAAK